MQRCTAAFVLAAVAGLATHAGAQNIHWNAGDGFWSDPSKWLGGVAPGPSNHAIIGSMVAAVNSDIIMDEPVDLADLTITDGMQLFTGNWSLDVAGDTIVAESNPLLGGGIRRSALTIEGVDGMSFMTHNLSVQTGGLVRLWNSYSRIANTMTMQADTRIEGNGDIRFASNHTNFVNDGTILAGSGLGMSLRQAGSGRFNLDGTSGNGIVSLLSHDTGTGESGKLRLEGIGLSDAFSGEIRMRGGSRLTMDLDEGWTADQSSVITMDAAGAGSNVGIITGTSFTFAGTANLLNQSDFMIRPSELTLAPSAVVNIGTGSLFIAGTNEYATQTTIDGAVFNAEHDASANFWNDTTIRGGTFNATAGSNSTMIFWDDTQWDGDLTVNGRLINHDGHASVSGATTITADIFEMGNMDSSWSVGAPLTINADALGFPGFEGLRGSMTITGGFTNNLTVNMTGPEDSWRVGGTLTIGGTLGNFPITRVSGSRMVVDGNLNVTTGIARVTSDADFSNSAAVSIDASATLRMQGITTVAPDTVFSGEGWLHNGVGATIRMADDSSLERVGLRNSGNLFIARAAAGSASVDRFESTADATWTVDIRGMLPGLGHDQLVTTGGSAILDGELIVLLDSAPGGFRPEVGDEFTILQASAGVFGTFVNVPGSFVGSVQYGWEVIYNVNSVVLRLERIVPTPGAIALFGLGGLLITRRRRIS